MSGCFFSFLRRQVILVDWYSHLVKNFPQFVVIHIVKGFGIISKAGVNVFLELFFDYPKASDSMDDNKLWKILKEIGISDHLTCLLKNLYAG